MIRAHARYHMQQKEDKRLAHKSDTRQGCRSALPQTHKSEIASRSSVRWFKTIMSILLQIVEKWNMSIISQPEEKHSHSWWCLDGDSQTRKMTDTAMKISSKGPVYKGLLGVCRDLHTVFFCSTWSWRVILSTFSWDRENVDWDSQPDTARTISFQRRTNRLKQVCQDQNDVFPSPDWRPVMLLWIFSRDMVMFGLWLTDTASTVPQHRSTKARTQPERSHSIYFRSTDCLLQL